MNLRAALLVFALPLALAACPSGETNTTASSSGGTTPPPSGGGNPALAGLETSPFMNEVWIGESGQQEGFLFYPRENLRVSARCRMPDGRISCEALQFMRFGMPVEILRRQLDGRTSAGVKVCMKLNHPIVVVHNSVGAEDSMCLFPDGSMVANGALERYAMRVIE
jgi:putative hemolysin